MIHSFPFFFVYVNSSVLNVTLRKYPIQFQNHFTEKIKIKIKKRKIKEEEKGEKEKIWHDTEESAY